MLIPIREDDDGFLISTILFRWKMSYLDRITGMLEGVALGDALGAPHEMHYNENIPYTGRLEQPVRYKKRFEGYRYRPVGSVTDDFEMTAALATSLVVQGGYQVDDVVRSYQEWANTNPPMGKNTRSLFQGVTTFKGYQARAKKTFVQPENLQSNGSLMRASPLACLGEPATVFVDCDLTNPNIVNRYCSWLYIEALRTALARPDLSGREIFGLVRDLSQRLPTPVEEITSVFQQITSGSPRDIKTKKGWVVNGFYCAMLTLAHQGTTFISPSQGFDYIVRLGGDTDTNTAIAGAIIGALVGDSGLRQDSVCLANLVVVGSGSERPTRYHPSQIPTLAMGLASLRK